MIKPNKWYLTVLFLVVGALQVAGASPAIMEGNLPRISKMPIENYPSLTTTYGDIQAGKAKLRTITTAPIGANGKLPAILYVQWLSCDTIELDPAAKDGWSLMLRRLLTESGMLVMRTDKAGVGDSVGIACERLDYETELAHHRTALAKLRSHPNVDPDRIFLVGVSMGSTMVPLLAQDQQVRGIVTWGGGARSWLERMVAFDRRALELSGHPPEGLKGAMQRHISFHMKYLAGQQSPAAMTKADPALAKVWKEIVGTESGAHYGRPFAFHHQAQNRDWAAAWSKLDVPVLALLGEYDWFEEPRSAELIARIANRKKPGSGEFHLVPKLDHNFSAYASAEAAFAEKDGVPDPSAAVERMLAWLRKLA